MSQTTARLTRGAPQVWPAVLTAVLGAMYPLVAATASSLVFALALVSGVAVAAAPWLARRSRPLGLAVLGLGAVPFAVATWWTLVTPLVAVLALVAGLIAMPDLRRRPSVTAETAMRR